MTGTEDEKQMNWNENDIRSCWAAALYDIRPERIAVIIEYGLSTQDLIVLGGLHYAGLYQSEIESLLTECNFHTECKNLQAGSYKNYMNMVIGD
jgi:hypothetical protein